MCLPTLLILQKWLHVYACVSNFVYARLCLPKVSRGTLPIFVSIPPNMPMNTRTIYSGFSPGTRGYISRIFLFFPRCQEVPKPFVQSIACRHCSTVNHRIQVAASATSIITLSVMCETNEQWPRPILCNNWFYLLLQSAVYQLLLQSTGHQAQTSSL